MSNSGKKKHTETASDDNTKTKDIPNVTSDVYFKLCMNNLELARDFLICNLPEKIKSRIHLETLELAPQEYLTAALRKRAADAVYTVKLKSPGDEPGYLVVHIEHQVKPQRKMALRMLEFMLTTMRQISENLPKNDDTPLPVVIPIILSNYPHPYPYSVRFLDLFTEEGQALVSTMLNGELPLVDLASTPDDTLKNQMRAAIMLMALKHVKEDDLKIVLPKLLKTISRGLKQGEVSPDEARKLVENMVYFLYDNGKNIPSDTGEVDNILATFEQQLPLDTGEIIMTLREHFEQRVQRSTQQGMQQGAQENTRHIVLNMLKDGMSDEQIYRYAEISADELEALKREQEDSETDSQH